MPGYLSAMHQTKQTMQLLHLQTLHQTLSPTCASDALAMGVWLKSLNSASGG
jgi:hypothetical protein